MASVTHFSRMVRCILIMYCIMCVKRCEVLLSFFFNIYLRGFDFYFILVFLFPFILVLC